MPMTIVPPDVFAERTANGWPVQMDTSIYEGMPFDCGCGSEHVYDRQSTGAIREMGGMRLVVRCPHGVDTLTCVKVQGFPTSTGLETLFVTRGQGGFVESYLEACALDARERGDGASLRRRNRWVAASLAAVGLLLIYQSAGLGVLFGWLLFGVGVVGFIGTTGAADTPPPQSTKSTEKRNSDDEEGLTRLVQTLQTLLIPSYPTFADEIPRLRDVDVEQYDFFITTAAVCSVLQGIQARKPHQYEAAKRAAEKGLTEVWGIDGPRAVLDCNQFVSNAMPSGEIEDIEEAMSTALGMWIVWNLLGEKPGDADYRLVGVAGLAAFQVGTSYWL